MEQVPGSERHRKGFHRRVGDAGGLRPHACVLHMHELEDFSFVLTGWKRILSTDAV